MSLLSTVDEATGASSGIAERDAIAGSTSTINLVLVVNQTINSI